MPTCVVNALGSFYAPATKVRFLALATQPPERMPATGQTRPRRPPGRRAYSRPVLPSKRTHFGPVGSGQLWAKSGNHAAQQIPSSARLIGIAEICHLDQPAAQRGLRYGEPAQAQYSGIISEPQASPMNGDR
jgi:hypothetical protein